MLKTLKSLLVYLPYNLNVLYRGDIYCLKSINFNDFFIILSRQKENKIYSNSDDWDNFIPILNPLDETVIESEFSSYHQSSEFLITQIKSSYYIDSLISRAKINNLAKKHIDIYGWIDKGIATTKEFPEIEV